MVIHMGSVIYWSFTSHTVILVYIIIYLAKDFHFFGRVTKGNFQFMCIHLRNNLYMSAVILLIETYAVIRFTNIFSKCDLSLQSSSDEKYYSEIYVLIKLCCNHSTFFFFILFSVFGIILQDPLFLLW